MKRDELRAQLEAKGIIMADWPAITSIGQVLVVDRFGCNPSLISVLWKCKTEKTQAEQAVVRWAELTEEVGGFSGDPYPNGQIFYAIFYNDDVVEVELSSEATISFYAIAGIA